MLYGNTGHTQKLHLLFMTSNRRALKQLSNSPNQSANGRCLSGQKPRRKICATSRKMVPTRSSEPGTFGEDRGTRASGWEPDWMSTLRNASRIQDSFEHALTMSSWRTAILSPISSFLQMLNRNTTVDRFSHSCWNKFEIKNGASCHICLFQLPSLQRQKHVERFVWWRRHLELRSHLQMGRTSFLSSGNPNSACLTKVESTLTHPSALDMKLQSSLHQQKSAQSSSSLLSASVSSGLLLEMGRWTELAHRKWIRGTSSGRCRLLVQETCQQWPVEFSFLYGTKKHTDRKFSRNTTCRSFDEHSPWQGSSASLSFPLLATSHEIVSFSTPDGGMRRLDDYYKRQLRLEIDFEGVIMFHKIKHTFTFQESCNYLLFSFDAFHCMILLHA